MAAAKAKTTDNGSRVFGDAALGVEIPTPDFRTLEIPITSITPLIVHSWDEKAKRQMLEKQMKRAAPKKEAKNPEADYLASMYISDEDWHGVPAVGFKQAMVDACRQTDGLSMTLAKRLFFIKADGRSSKKNVDLVRIEGTPRPREDMVRLKKGGSADIRYRAEYPEWSATLTVEYNARLISAEQIVNLVELAGYSEGVCEWRPSSPESATGIYGRWKVNRGSQE